MVLNDEPEEPSFLQRDHEVLPSVIVRRRVVCVHPNPAEAGELLGVSRQFVDKLIADGRLAAQFKPGSRHRVVRVVDVLELEASRRAGADRIGATIDTLVDAGAEY
jgi:excisionase family DNA binding protein